MLRRRAHTYAMRCAICAENVAHLFVLSARTTYIVLIVYICKIGQVIGRCFGSMPNNAHTFHPSFVVVVVVALSPCPSLHSVSLGYRPYSLARQWPPDAFYSIELKLFYSIKTFSNRLTFQFSATNQNIIALQCFHIAADKFRQPIHSIC